MFRSLKIYNYRIWSAGSLVSNIGTWMQTTAQAWVVLTVLSNGDASAMGLALALQFAPHILLVGLTGWVTDRFDRRKILFVTQGLLGSASTCVAILLLTGAMTLPVMYALIFVSGVVQAFDTPARLVTVADIVTLELVPNAVALNAASVNSARLVGPGAAGILLVLLAPGWVFLINAASFVAMITAVALLRVKELIPHARLTDAHGVAEGFHYVRKRSDLVVVFVMAFLVGSFGLNLPIFTSTMTLEFGYGPEGFGLLTSALALGALAGSLFAASRVRVSLHLVIVSAGAFGVSFAAAAMMPNFWPYAGTIVSIGFAMSIVTSLMNAYVQTTTEPTRRGRVLALYMAVIFGGAPVIALLLGWLASMFGPRAASWAGSSAGLVACAVGLIWMLAMVRTRMVQRATSPVLSFAEGAVEDDETLVPEDFSDILASDFSLDPDDGEDSEEEWDGPKSPG